MNAAAEPQNDHPALPGAAGRTGVEARAQLAVEVTPKRFRLMVGAVFRLPLCLLDLLRYLLRVLF